MACDGDSDEVNKAEKPTRFTVCDIIPDGNTLIFGDARIQLKHSVR